MNQLESIAALLGSHLQEQGQVVATAESCTGGLVAAALTSIVGSSTWFGYGFVTYSNEAKCRVLGVQAQTLRTSGAVSEATVSEMALGALRVSGADWAVAVSGIAGPDGGSKTKPVGTIWFAVASRDGSVASFLHQFLGERNEIRTSAAVMALQHLIDQMSINTIRKGKSSC